MPVFEALGTIYTRCCATCKHWEKAGGLADAHGHCRVNTYPDKSFHPGHDVQLWNPMLTLDLALCSKWQDKEDAE